MGVRGRLITALLDKKAVIAFLNHLFNRLFQSVFYVWNMVLSTEKCADNDIAPAPFISERKAKKQKNKQKKKLAKAVLLYVLINSGKDVLYLCTWILGKQKQKALNRRGFSSWRRESNHSTNSLCEHSLYIKNCDQW